MGKTQSKGQLLWEEEQPLSPISQYQNSSSSESLSSNLENESQFQNEEVHVPYFYVKPTPFTQNKGLQSASHLAIPLKECCWMEVFYHPQLFDYILDYLTQQEDLNIILCSHRMESEVFMRRIKRLHNWPTTFLILEQKISSDIYCYFSQSQEESEHSLDLDRTFSFFQAEDDLQGQVAKLDRVMRALSFNVSYFQGLNSIVAVFLSYYDENKTYWLVRYLISKTQNIHNNQDLYVDFMSQIEEYVEKNNEKVFEHFEKNDLTIEYFAMRWIMGLFSYDIERETLMYLWDLICFHSLKALKWFIVGILEELKEQILFLDGDELNETFKNNLKKVISREKAKKLIEFVKKMIVEEKFKVEESIFNTIPPLCYQKELK